MSESQIHSCRPHPKPEPALLDLKFKTPLEVSTPVLKGDPWQEPIKVFDLSGIAFV